MLTRVCGARGCLDLSSSTGVWLRTISALRKEPCSGSLFCVCGNLGPFGNFSVSSWPRVYYSEDVKEAADQRLICWLKDRTESKRKQIIKDYLQSWYWAYSIYTDECREESD